VLGDVVDAYLFGSLRDLDEYESRIRAVTPAAMRQVAREHFNPARRVEGLVRGTGKRV
jgi:predicted Zn-dependent peptidase